MHYAVMMMVVEPTLFVQGVIYPDCACDFHFLALIKAESGRDHWYIRADSKIVEIVSFDSSNTRTTCEKNW